MKNYFHFLIDGEDELSWPEAVLLAVVVCIVIITSAMIYYWIRGM